MFALIHASHNACNNERQQRSALDKAYAISYRVLKSRSIPSTQTVTQILIDRACTSNHKRDGTNAYGTAR